MEVGGQQTCWRRGPGAEGEGCFLERRQELGATVKLETVPKTVLTSDTICKLGGPQNRLRVYNS